MSNKRVNPFKIKIHLLDCELEEKNKRISELEAKLAESEEKKESYRLQNDEHHLQLLQFYSRLGVEAFGADIHEKALETLMIMKEQLAEKEKELDKLQDELHGYYEQIMNKGTCGLCEYVRTDYKISFAITKLEKMKEVLLKSYSDNIYQFSMTNGIGKLTFSEEYLKTFIDKKFDNQIKQLKEEARNGKNKTSL